MEDSNLFSLIKSFAKNEVKDVQRFLDSPVHNTREDLRLLFDYLYQSELPEKHLAWKQLFPDRNFDDTAMRLLMSYLNKLLEKYLASEETQKDEIQNRLKLAVAYRKRALTTQYHRHIKSIERSLQEQPLRNIDHYEKLRHLAFEQQETITSINPADTSALRTLIQATDAHYLATRLRLLCLEAAQKNVYRAGASTANIGIEHEPSTQFLDLDTEIIKLARHTKWADYPAISIYLTTWQMLTDPDSDTYFQLLKSQLEDYANAFTPREMRELYLAAINHCIRRLNDGESAYAHEALHLFKTALTSGFLFENGLLSRFTFHNIVAAGLRAGELAWSRQFITDYHTTLEKQYQDSSYSFNMARIELAEKKYDSVLSLLQSANYRDTLLNLAAKVLLLKTLYALNEIDTLHSQLDAMRNYIHRSEVIGYHKTNYLNIIKHLERVLKTNLKDSDKVSKIRTRIEQEPILSERNWLLECAQVIRN